MKKLILLIPALIVGSLHANDWKFSITLGVGSIDYEEDRFFTDEDNNLTGDQANLSDTYSPSIVGFGYGNGTHTFGYKVTSASSSEFDYESSIEPRYNRTVSLRERDYEETTISYQYRINSSWTLGVAYNDKENDYLVTGFNSYDMPFWESFLAAGETAGYRWDDVANYTYTQDGFAVYGTWQTLLTDKWVFAAKVGVSQTDLDGGTVEVQTISGIPAALDSVFINSAGESPGVNGSTITYRTKDQGDSTTIYGGVSLVRIFPGAPNHQIIFSIDGRTDDLGGSSEYLDSGVGTGYFTSSGDDVENTPPSETAQIEEYNLKYTLEYKYTF